MASLFKNQPAAQTAKITVDAEHYCTSVTQMAMAQMYPDLIALSVTMPQHLLACWSWAAATRRAFSTADPNRRKIS